MDEMTHHGLPTDSTVLILLFIVFPICLLCLYTFLACRRRRLSGWSGWRMASFSLGIMLIVIAVLPPIASWAHHDLRGHMLQHLLLGMFGPLGLVFGAPGTLLVRSLPGSVARRFMDLMRLPPVRLLTHPITAAFLDIGGMYLLYLTPLFGLCMSHPVLFVLVHIHFVLSGYLFTWSIAGPDPAPHRPSRELRLVVVFLATAAHAVLGKLMYGYEYPHGMSASLIEVQLAAQWMYYGGDIAELLLITGLFASWFRHRSALPEFMAIRNDRARDNE
ncbi:MULTISPECIES: cytochrome c oxidase assembly protein [unclassified Pantoea]|uniref:cytochrome c oxidase assembly protein n=1 Tax=unclassified Pantoea TaxID=2630326 RepID=UPI00301BE394